MALIAAALEGVISSITANGTGATLVVMGMTVDVDKAVADNRKLRAPKVTKGKLTIAQLLDPTPFRGRADAGFVGGTAIVQGNFNTTTGRFEVKFLPLPPANQGAAPFELHPAIEVGPPESLVAGPVTRNDGGVLSVNNVPIKLPGAADPRLPGVPPANEFGFDIKLDTVLVGTPASVDGYFSTSQGAFIGFDFIIDGIATLTMTGAQVSITRAQGRNRGAEYDVNLRGGVTTTHAVGNLPQRLQIFRVDSVPEAGGVAQDQLTLLGSASAPLIAGGFSKWNFNSRITALPAPLDRVPERILVRNVSPGANDANGRSAEAVENDVEILKE